MKPFCIKLANDLKKQGLSCEDRICFFSVILLGVILVILSGSCY